jgi:hypothetical protein
LLADLIVVPTGAVEFRQNVFSAGIGFVDHEEDLSRVIDVADFKRSDGRLPSGSAITKFQISDHKS